MTGFAFGGGTEHGSDIVLAFDVRLRCKIQVPPVGLRFARKCGFQIPFRFRSFELHRLLLLFKYGTGPRRTSDKPGRATLKIAAYPAQSTGPGQLLD